MKSLLGIGECMMELSSMGDQLWKQGFAGGNYFPCRNSPASAI